MIDINHEDLYSLQATRTLEIWPAPKQPCLRSLRCWTTKGIYGVKLETVRIGKKLYTSALAIERFVVESTRAADQARLAAAESKAAPAETLEAVA